MKKVLKPSEPEDAIYYSDFSGRLFEQFVPVTVTIECNYGSKYDGSKIELHLSDKGLDNLLIYLKDRLCKETKEEIKRQIDSSCQSSDDLYNNSLYKKLI
jgi:uncharacterized protein YwgA